MTGRDQQVLRFAQDHREAAPLRFTFGLHLHQPVGNFDSVFEQHVRDVYRPILERMVDRGLAPIAMHLSGSLLEWLERHDTAFLDALGRRVADGKVELLLAGMYEPVLASLPREDRVAQVRWLHDALHARFGVLASGLWLTERVWEPDLASDLAGAGVRFVIVDDRHFLISGIARDRLHAHWVTEHGGARVEVFPIDERLRYLIPFRPPAEIGEYLAGLRDRGHRLAILADDGEKFGGWPGTLEWVYNSGWLDGFVAELQRLRAQGIATLSTFADALAHTPSAGLAYLPSASYREMEAWSLPPQQARRLAALGGELGEERLAGPEGLRVRGSHWRHFLARYAESNRMHKHMLALSALARVHFAPEGVRRAIGRAQCNDAYWHGVFGGLYLPFLRAAVWRNLAEAESALRAGQSITAEHVDHDFDGRPEWWIHSPTMSIVIAPHRGGAIETWLRLAERENLADALTRRREAYHFEAVERGEAGGVDTVSAQPALGGTPDRGDSATIAGGTASIHDIEHAIVLNALPPEDLDVRAVGIERVIAGSVTHAAFSAADYVPLASWAGADLESECLAGDREVEVLMTGDGLIKRVVIEAGGAIVVHLTWEPARYPREAWFCTELSMSRAIGVDAGLHAEVWQYDVETIAKSERGLDRTVQGVAMVASWPVTAGHATVRLVPGGL